MNDEMAAWLASLGLGQYAQTFAEQHIDFEVLHSLDEQHLKQLGLSLGHRIRLRQAVAKLASDKNQRATVAVAERRQLTVMFVDLGRFNTAVSRT